MRTIYFYCAKSSGTGAQWQVITLGLDHIKSILKDEVAKSKRVDFQVMKKVIELTADFILSVSRKFHKVYPVIEK